jgi:transposase
MTKKTLPKWTDERTEQLVSMVNGADPVPYSVVEAAAEALGTSNRSVAGKLRKMDYNVEPASSVEKAKTFSDDEAAELSDFVTSNSGEYTFAEIASVFADGKFSAKQVQGKLLAMELLAHVKPTPKKDTPKKYSDSEEARFIEMVNGGSFVEDIADELGRTIESVRGKALALSRSHGLELPKQRESHAKGKTDALEALGDISEMTVDAIAEAIEKTPRGVRSMLTHRKMSCADYDGAARAEKIAERRAANG